MLQFDHYDQDQFKKQVEREELMFSLGLQKFKEKLSKQKLGNDYSRSSAGKAVEYTQLDLIAQAIEAAASSKMAGVNSREIQKLYASLSAVTEFDLKTGLPTGETFNVWSSEVLALITLRFLLDSCRMPIHGIDGDKTIRPSRRVLAQSIGTHIEGELMSRQMRHYFPDSDRRLGYISRIAKESSTRNASRDRALYAKQRKIKSAHEFWLAQQSPVALALEWEPWTRDFKEKLARKCIGVITALLEDQNGVRLFQDNQNVGRKFFVGFTPEGERWADSFDETTGESTFVPLPMLVEPLDHTQERRGGYLDVDKTTHAKHANRSFKGHLEASDELLAFANNTQRVPYRINPFIADLLEQVYAESGSRWNIGSFGPIPTIEDYPTEIPENLRELDPSDPAKIQARLAAKEAHDKFVQEKKCWVAEIPRFMEVMKLSRKNERFYIPTYLDFRGRVYYTHVGFQPQGCDHQKAILEWADPVPVDDRTEFWLMQQITACMGYDKVSFEERVSKVLEVKQHLIESVADPMGTSWWKKQDKPWSLLAAAAEWVRLFVHQTGPRETHARVNFDASSSGQQLISGMTQDYHSADAVNITPGPAPRDIYGNVVRTAKALIAAQGFIVPTKLDHIPQAKLRAIGRGHGKAVCMVAQYSAGTDARIKALKDYTHEKATIEKLGVEGLTQEEAGIIYHKFFAEGLAQEMPALDDYIGWVRGAVKAALADNLESYILLPSADGSIVHQTYIKMDDSGRIKTDHIGSAKFREATEPFQRMVTTKPTDVTVLEDQVKSTPPNLIHAQDRSALALALGDFEGAYSTVHDSIYGRPGAEMDVIKDRLLKAYYKIFTSNVLEEFVTINGLSLEDHPVPMKDTYDPALVLVADYAFS